MFLRLAIAVCLVAPVTAFAAGTSKVQLALPDGRAFSDPVAVTLDEAFAFTQGPAGSVRAAVDPRYAADLERGWFEMAAGVSVTTECISSCSPQTISLGTFIITQPLTLTSPDKRPIQVTASWTTLASIDMPVDAWVDAQFKLGLLSGSYTPQPTRNTWLECWANSDSAATKARCPNPLSTRVPLDTVDTRTIAVQVTSGSTLQLEVFGVLRLSAPMLPGTSSFSGTMLLDPQIQIVVPAGTIVESGSFPVTVIPEPSGASLSLLGLAILAGVYRRQRRLRSRSLSD
jgi:hypothetical protein